MIDEGSMSHRLNAAGWGLFFVWVGIALLMKLSWGVGLLGVGVIIFGGQAVRMGIAMRLEKFWAVVGVLFVVGGIWELLSVRVSLVPVLCIVAGITLLASALAGRPVTRVVGSASQHSQD